MEAQAGPGQGGGGGAPGQPAEGSECKFLGTKCEPSHAGTPDAGCGPIRIGRPANAAGLPLADNASVEDRVPVEPRSKDLQGPYPGVLHCGQ